MYLVWMLRPDQVHIAWWIPRNFSEDLQFVQSLSLLRNDQAMWANENLAHTACMAKPLTSWLQGITMTN
jgi:hypothetical protein